jgi:hypothetical protein
MVNHTQASEKTQKTPFPNSLYDPLSIDLLEKRHLQVWDLPEEILGYVDSLLLRLGEHLGFL